MTIPFGPPEILVGWPTVHLAPTNNWPVLISYFSGKLVKSVPPDLSDIKAKMHQILFSLGLWWKERYGPPKNFGVPLWNGMKRLQHAAAAVCVCLFRHRTDVPGRRIFRISHATGVHQTTVRTTAEDRHTTRGQLGHPQRYTENHYLAATVCRLLKPEYIIYDTVLYYKFSSARQLPQLTPKVGLWSSCLLYMYLL